MPKLDAMNDNREAEITAEQVKYIADLARLELNNKEIKRLTRELGEIIHYINRLNELDTTKVEPSYSLDGNCRLRDDVVKESMPRASLLKEAPQHDDESILVPVVITSE